MMHSTLKLFFVFSSLSFSFGDADTSNCPPTLTRNAYLKSFRDTCLRFVTTEKEWIGARDDCKNTGGGQLVQILDAETQSFVVSTLKSLHWDHNGVWIGANDLQQEGTWVWVTGQPVTYSNWLDGAGPQHTGFFSSKYIDDCAEIRLDHGGQWKDKPCESIPLYHYSFICQYDKISTPAPTTTTTLPTSTETTSEAVPNTPVTEISESRPTSPTSKGSTQSNFNLTLTTDIKPATRILIPITESRHSTKWITRGTTERSTSGTTDSWSYDENESTSQSKESQPSTGPAFRRTTNMVAVVSSTYEDAKPSDSLMVITDNEVTKSQGHITGNSQTRNSPIILNSIKVNSETPTTTTTTATTTVTSAKETPGHRKETTNSHQYTEEKFWSSAQNHAFGSTSNDSTRNLKFMTSHNSLTITDAIVTNQMTGMKKESSTFSASGNLVTHSNSHVAPSTDQANSPSKNIKNTTRVTFGQTTNKYNMASTLSQITSKATKDLKQKTTSIVMTTQSGTGREQTDKHTTDYIQDKARITRMDITQSRGNNGLDSTAVPNISRNIESTSYFSLPSKRTSRPFHNTPHGTEETVTTTTHKQKLSGLIETTVKPTIHKDASDQQGKGIISSTKASKLTTLTPLLNKQHLSKKKSNTTAILVGAIVGGLVFCIVIITAFIFMRRRSKRPNEETEDYDIKQSEITFNNSTYGDWNRDSVPTGENDA